MIKVKEIEVRLPRKLVSVTYPEILIMIEVQKVLK